MSDHLVMTIDHDAMRGQFLNNARIYGNVIVRDIKRAELEAERVLDPDDIHSFVVAIDVALSCVGSQAALDEVRELVREFAGKIAEANRGRVEKEVCPECGSDRFYDIETLPVTHVCHNCGEEWFNKEEDDASE